MQIYGGYIPHKVHERCRTILMVNKTGRAIMRKLYIHMYANISRAQDETA